MRYRYTASAALLISLAAILPLSASAQVGYYPTAAPSSYYVLPGQTLSFSGRGFAPSENIFIAGPGGGIATVNSGTGSFAGAGSYTIPFSYENSTRTFSVGGIPLRVVVGTFYPNIAPSAYYIAPGEEMTALATGFAPGETIALYMNNSFVIEGTANQNGSLSFYFPAPEQGNAFTLEAYGLSSGTHSSRTVTLW